MTKNSFCSGQRVVLRPLRPLARMAPENIIMPLILDGVVFHAYIVGV